MTAGPPVCSSVCEEEKEEQLLEERGKRRCGRSRRRSWRRWWWKGKEAGRGPAGGGDKGSGDARVGRCAGIGVRVGGEGGDAGALVCSSVCIKEKGVELLEERGRRRCWRRQG